MRKIWLEIANRERNWQADFYTDWSRAVRQRDGNICRRCKGDHGLSVHHIHSYHLAPHERFSITNGILLCTDCYQKIKDKTDYESLCQELIHTRKESSIEVLLRLQNLKENQQIAPSGAETRNLENGL